MIAPNAEQIEAAAENILRGTTAEPVASYPTLTDFVHDEQLKELASAMGADTLKRLGSAYPLTDDFQTGYQLGLQAARMVLLGSPKLALARIDPKDVL